MYRSSLLSNCRPSQDAKLTWRRDVEGLRGIAVLAVLIFHAAPTWLPGGFLGVDVFFVISGYVVGRGIIGELSGGHFSYAKFYARRAKRIIPALLVVLASSLVIAPFFLGSDDYQALGQQIAATVLFAANFLAWSQSGYFEQEAAYRPLIHLWSLGIEEQFYALLPIALVYLWGKYRPNAGQIISLAACLSFASCVLLSIHDGSSAFYFPFTRFWELLVGTLLAWYGCSTRENADLKSTLVSLSGAITLFGSLFLVTESQAFPGWEAAVPVIGSMVILATGPHALINRTILSRGILPWLGRISYSAYLWHWPVLVFARYGLGGNPTVGIAMSLIVVSLALAWLSTRFIENPIRLGTWSKNGNTTKILWLTLLVLGVVAVPVSSMTVGRVSPALIMLEHYPRPDYDIWREAENCFVNLNNNIPFGSDCMGSGASASPLIAVWGDSHAAHLWPGLRKEASLHNWRIAQFTASQCPALISGAGEGNNKCQIIRTRAIAAIGTVKPKTVILASRWTLYRQKDVLDAIGPTISALKDLGVKRVIVIGPVPMWMPTLAKALVYDMRREHLFVAPTHTTTGFQESAFAMDGQLRRATESKGGHFISALNVMCPQSRNCKVWVDDVEKNTLTTYDNGHFTEQHSEWFASKISPEIFE